MLETEATIQTVLNQAGTITTGEALKHYDTNGSAIEIDGNRWTSKGEQPKTYQTPYGMVEVMRHVYQSNQGGRTFCPLEVDASIITTSTPRFAQQIAHKYAEMSSVRVVADLKENHGRDVHRSFVQTLAETVGTIAAIKAEDWHYHTPKLATPIPTVSIGMDGTCVLLCEDGYRQTMVGTISLYDAYGERQHTTYVAAAPERGRATFLTRLQQEVAQVKRLYPNAHYQGLADGAPENWTFLEPLTDTQVLDFFHATHYLDLVAKALHPRSHEAQEAWLSTAAHRLKHEVGAAAHLLTEMELIQPKRLSQTRTQGLHEAITYFRNHQHQMHYAEAIAQHLPIGSGVTEAGCKVIVKDRLCRSGMKWKEVGAGIVLSLRTLTYTPGRWQQFWSKIERYGFTLPE
jgi:hypothetical protein